MIAETEKMLTDVARVTNVAVEGELVLKEKRYLRFHERETRREELQKIERQLKEPTWVQAGLTSEAKAGLRKRLRVVEKDLTDNSPPTDLSTATRDALIRREHELAVNIQQGMPTAEQMRRNPTGAVGANTRWHKAHVKEVLEWKNLRVVNNPDSDDKDLANVDILRSSQMVPDGSSTFMPSAQIPGLFAMTPLAKANWPLGEPTVTTATSHLSPPIAADGADVNMEPNAFARCLGTPGHECGRIIKWNRKRCTECNKTWFQHRVKPLQEKAVATMTAVKRRKSKAFHEAIDRKIQRRIAKQEAANKAAAEAQAREPAPDRLAAVLAYAMPGSPSPMRGEGGEER